MSASTIRNIVIDNRLEQYESFIDYAWVKEIHAVGRGTSLEGTIHDLTFAWKGATNVHRMPWLMMNVLKSTLEGYANMRDPLPVKVISHLAERLTQADATFTKAQRNRLKNLLLEIDKRVRKELPKNPANFDKEVSAYWDDMITSPDFAISLWKLAQTVYAAIYYGYEDFVGACTGLSLEKSGYRIQRQKDFACDFIEAFGNELYEKCWSDDRIQLSRRIRNAIVHNGGRLSRELIPYKEKLRIVDGQIVIMASVCSSLFGFLKYCALTLALATKSNIEK